MMIAAAYSLSYEGVTFGDIEGNYSKLSPPFFLIFRYPFSPSSLSHPLFSSSVFLSFFLPSPPSFLLSPLPSFVFCLPLLHLPLLQSFLPSVRPSLASFLSWLPSLAYFPLLLSLASLLGFLPCFLPFAPFLGFLTFTFVFFLPSFLPSFLCMLPFFALLLTSLSSSW